MNEESRYSRENGSKGLVNDPLAEILLDSNPARRHPSPSQIRTYRGDATVVPFIFSDMVYFLSPERRTEGSLLLHFSNTEGRPKFYGLGFENNDPDQIIQIYTHDGSEDLGLRRISGNYAFARIIGEMFGQNHYDAHMALTNIRGTLGQQLKRRLKLKNNFTRTTPQQTVDALDYLITRVANNEDQTRVYHTVRESVESYRNAVDSFTWWGEDDRKEAKGIAQKVLKIIERLSNDLIPTTDIQRNVEPYFTDFRSYVALAVPDAESFGQDQRVILNPHCQLRGQESPLFHMIHHDQYGTDGRSYIGDLFDFASRFDSLNPVARLIPRTKNQEAGDNFRKESENTPWRQHQTYQRGLDLFIAGDSYLKSLMDKGVADADLDKSIADFSKGQLLMRVIKDYTNIASEPDADFEGHRLWLVDQYRRIQKFVGEDIESGLVAELEMQRGSPIERRGMFAEKLLAGQRELTDILEGKPRRGTMRNWLARAHLI